MVIEFGRPVPSRGQVEQAERGLASAFVCTPRWLTRMRCRATHTLRFSDQTCHQWCCNSRSWESMTLCTLTSWTHLVCLSS